MTSVPDSSTGSAIARPADGLVGRFAGRRASMLALAAVLALFLVAVFGHLMAPYPDHIRGALDVSNRFQPPSMQHPFGTNELGQDVLSLVLGGARVSVFSAVIIIGLSALIGTVIGSLAGFFGRILDETLMRFTDLMLTIPSLFLAMAVAAALGQGVVNLVIAITLATWPGYARLVRGEVCAVRGEMYVQAALSMGAGRMRVLFRHVLPNVAPAIIVKASLEISFAMITVASLGFIGIGVAPPTPEWGSMLSIARGYVSSYWWMAVFPGLAIMASVFAFNLLGDGLREALDPRSEG